MNLSGDPIFLQRAIDLAAAKLPLGEGGPFAAVIVKDGQVIAEGWNRVIGTCDPTAHAEVQAIRAAGQALGAFHLHGCVLYSSCEPCPMCLAACYWAHLERVVYAADRTRAAQSGFDDAFLYDELPLPPERRRLQLIRLLPEQGDAPFRQWDAMLSKTPY